MTRERLKNNIIYYIKQSADYALQFLIWLIFMGSMLVLSSIMIVVFGKLILWMWGWF
jgi:hypothetical protein